MTHCEMFQTEEIQVIIGDASRDGAGGQQYCGIWSLTSKHRVFNAFGNSYAGLIFGTPEWLRFFCSPSGGGGSLFASLTDDFVLRLPGKSCPAWDFEWVIPNDQYEVGREYELKMRLVYKQFVSDEDVLAEYKAAYDAWGINP